MTINKRFGHRHYNVSELVSLLVHPSDLEVQLLRFFCLPKLLVRFENALQLVLQNVRLYDYHRLRLKNFILLHLAFTL